MGRLRRSLGPRLLRLLALDLQYKVPNVDLVGFINGLLGIDLAAIDVGAIRALEIDDIQIIVSQKDTAVLFGDVSLGQHDIIALHTPDGDLGLGEVVLGLLPTFFADRNAEHKGQFLLGESSML